ncbi:unnamed protein product [Onchocerca ochengi]|uniref:Secreted protein n=1 Tax=Onchocerca ochengi TaxID=42157 RepID=A0A182EIZ1_ONCOC|nr:unnamed protein product [Onchocerca ochengi]
MTKWIGAFGHRFLNAVPLLLILLVVKVPTFCNHFWSRNKFPYLYHTTTYALFRPLPLTDDLYHVIH